jgi:peptide/nickel transport system permease protein
VLGYLVGRLVGALAVALIVLSFLALLANLVPGDPAAALVGPRATPELVERARRELHLDEPVPVQVWLFMQDLSHGSLGTDFISRRPVTTIVFNVLPHTLILAVMALVFASSLGIPMGVYAATHPGTWLDRFLRAFSISVITAPVFVIALLLLLVFAVWLRVLPALGAGSLSDPIDYVRRLILPTVALGAAWVGYLARLVRASMLEVLNQPYIRTARSLGISERTVSFRYALKNALIPTVAVLGVSLGSLMGGALFVETIFARAGLGGIIVDAVEVRNFPVVRGGVVVAAFLFIIVNLCVDILYRYLDPRLRVEEGSAGG